MDLGRPPLARFPSGDLRLADDVISSADLEHAISKVHALLLVIISLQMQDNRAVQLPLICLW